MTNKKYTEINDKYGHYSSWAIYSDSEIFDLSILKKHNSYSLVNPNVVFVGLNISQRLESLSNFHGTTDSHYSSLEHASKIRDTFKGTRFYGGYMTDIIKNFEESDSGKMMNYLKVNEEFEKAKCKKY